LSFKNYKNNSKSDLEKLQSQLEKDEAKQSYQTDPDDWYPGVDKAGNGMAIIRLLPHLEDEEYDYVKWLSHSFQYPEDTGHWYIENSLKTHGEEYADPVAEYNKKLWNSTTDPKHPNRLQASKQKRKLNFRSNIYVIADPINPENNGKVKKWKYGKFFYDMIRSVTHPPKIEGLKVQKKPANPFDLLEGMNLEINIFTEKKDGKAMRNYTRSIWSPKCPLFEDEDEIEAVYNEINSDPKWSLAAYVAPDKFKTYDQLKARLDFVIGLDTKTGKPLDDNGIKTEAKEPVEGKTTSAKTLKAADKENDDDYFQSLVDNDDDDIPFK